MDELKDNENRNSEQFLEELFKYNYCPECGKDSPEHLALPIIYNDCVMWFAKCKE